MARTESSLRSRAAEAEQPAADQRAQDDREEGFEPQGHGEHPEESIMFAWESRETQSSLPLGLCGDSALPHRSDGVFEPCSELSVGFIRRGAEWVADLYTHRSPTRPSGTSGEHVKGAFET